MGQYSRQSLKIQTIHLPVLRIFTIHVTFRCGYLLQLPALLYAVYIYLSWKYTVCTFTWPEETHYTLTCPESIHHAFYLPRRMWTTFTFCVHTHCTFTCPEDTQYVHLHVLRIHTIHLPVVWMQTIHVAVLKIFAMDFTFPWGYLLQLPVLWVHTIHLPVLGIHIVYIYLAWGYT